MWKRDCELDTEALPIPSRIASNEEFIPPQQTPQQKEYQARLHVLAVLGPIPGVRSTSPLGVLQN
jgi:hypothetical protein